MRLPFRRAVAVPAETLAAASLGKGEKVLAGTVDRSGAWLLGTRDALVVVSPTSPEGSRQVTRTPWQEVERADWDRDEGRLVVVEVGEFGERRPAHTFDIEEPGLLLELVRERVTASVVLHRRVPLQGRTGLFVIARRAPRGDSAVTWAFEFDPGIDPRDPGVMAAAEQAMKAAQDELGM